MRLADLIGATALENACAAVMVGGEAAETQPSVVEKALAQPGWREVHKQAASQPGTLAFEHAVEQQGHTVHSAYPGLGFGQRLDPWIEHCLSGNRCEQHALVPAPGLFPPQAAGSRVGVAIEMLPELAAQHRLAVGAADCGNRVDMKCFVGNVNKHCKGCSPVLLSEAGSERTLTFLTCLEAALQFGVTRFEPIPA